MRLNEIDNDLKDAAFEYFYWHSRFESALKENNFLESHVPGDKAKPGWKEFQEKHCSEYVATPEASRLVELQPKRQVVTTDGELDWVPAGVLHCKDDLCRVVTMLRTVRNNLFHGGKHGDTEMDSKKRNLELLTIGKLVLDQLAVMSGLENDYKRYY